jgi:mono/diheme cytochrome c family protein
MKFPGKMNFIFISTVALFFSVAVMAAANALPGADAPEGFPNGCIDCHSATADADFTMSATMGKFENHPSVTAMVKNVPSDCMMCHGKDSYGGEFKSIIHEIHLERSGDDGFVKNYGQNCLACHSGYPKPGEPLIKSAEKNW